ncbi:translation initiation factor IF-3 [Uranotaenia lowii]|uniref:translation initiation factor IF-3 n=1 Tax=Uranotaenia lowii TaxID=190385 RepID=UPI002479D421|nr:translation initiation factor IF-3 [Uranotaenia lowii]
MNIVWRIVQLNVSLRSPAWHVAQRNLLPAVSNGPLISSLQHYSSKGPREGVKGTPSSPNRPHQPAGAKVKQPGPPKITLISPDQSIAIISLDEAQKISKRRDLKLVKIVDLDIKTQRPIYKLMTSAEYLSEDLKRREEKKRIKQEATIKGDKLLTISAKITEHDLGSKVQNVLKWLKKSYEVRIIISGDGDKSKQESVAAQLETSTKEMGKVVQKRFRDNDLRFSILPTTSIAADKSEPPKSIPVPEKLKPEDGSGGKQPTSIGGGQQQAVRAFHTGRTLEA